MVRARRPGSSPLPRHQPCDPGPHWAQMSSAVECHPPWALTLPEPGPENKAGHALPFTSASLLPIPQGSGLWALAMPPHRFGLRGPGGWNDQKRALKWVAMPFSRGSS